MLKRDIFGQPIWVKKFILKKAGMLTRNRLVGFNNLKISGSIVLKDLPDKNVLFVSNHQTIFMDAIAMYHVFFASKIGQFDSIEKRGYLKSPKTNIYFIAARETMKKGILPKIFNLAGGITIDRTWRQGEEMIQRAVNPDDVDAIGHAIKDGWVITFPQGTTKVGAPLRKGTAYIIKHYQPIVVPVKLDGFRKAFDKTGLKVLKRGIELSVVFGEPLKINYERDTKEKIIDLIASKILE